MTRCRDCGDQIRPDAPGYVVDGTATLLCPACVAIAVVIAYRNELARAIHDAAHGWPAARCPVCWRVAA